ncbi:MAG: glycerol-3-phosphate 1-O-acyltransferase PlsY [Rhodomicrobium sp.]|nr:glycerol-3-phosphate 1-O-acyltransferase PlsY [Rhodomicrobium sp.]
MALNEKDLWFAVMVGAQPWLVYAGAFLAGYALGSIPFGYVLTRLAGAGDIRKAGSGNIGATNVLRTGRKGLALLTLLLDAGKGLLPVLLCKQYLGLEAALFAAAGAFLGHLFPVWLSFRGGKGVASYIGVISALYWPAGAFFCAVWLCIAVITRYSSLSALVAAALTPFFILVQVSTQLFVFVLALSALLIARHHKNIRNLISGHESKIGQSAPSGTGAESS